MPRRKQPDATPALPIELKHPGRTPTRIAEARGPGLGQPAGAQHLYRAPVADFLADVASGGLTISLTSRFEQLEGKAPSQGEIGSWEHSLPSLASVLADERLRGSEIFVELWMPLGGCRCDAVLTGRNLDHEPAAVVVELKQWTHVDKSRFHNEVWVMNASRLHPSVQVAGYVGALQHSNSACVDDGVRVTGCAWLHNLADRRAAALLRDLDAFGQALKECPLFVKGEERRFAEWLFAELGHGDGTRAASLIAAGRRKPSEKLLDLVVETIRGEHAWRLIGNQLVVFNRIVYAVEQAREKDARTVVLVHGAPGTGKSVLAIQLLAYGAKRGWKVLHATGSQAFQTNLRAKTLKFAGEMHQRLQGARLKKDLPVRDVFCTFAEVAKSGALGHDPQDLVVADEAHRLWDFRKLKYPNGTTRALSDTPMIEEVIRASRVSAFFLDDNQAVRAGEIGHSGVIRDAARRLGVEVVEAPLDAQFRCNGSESYVKWVDALLGFRDDSDLAWRRAEEYSLRVEEDVARMDQWLRGRLAAGLKCRIVAGYCWRWSKPLPGDRLVHDVKDERFGGWSAPWIEKTGQARQPMDNQYFRWANEDAYYEQVGSIYSVQGFEFDHVGVIWGEDLVWRKDHWEARLEKNKDKTFKRDIMQSGGEDAATVKLRNVYRVLLTRGMLGTSLFVLDKETRAKVRSTLEERRVAARWLGGGLMPRSGP